MKALFKRLNTFKSLVILIVVLLFLSLGVIGILFANTIITNTKYRNNAYALKANSYLTEINDKISRYSTAMRVAALNPTIRENIFRDDVNSSEMINLSLQMEKAVIASSYLLIDQEYAYRQIFYCYLPTDGKYFFELSNMASQDWYSDFLAANKTDFDTFIYNSVNSEYEFLMFQTINDFNVTNIGAQRPAECYEILRISVKGLFRSRFSTSSEVVAHPYIFSKTDGTLVYADNNRYSQDAQAVYAAALQGSMESIQNYRWNGKLSSGHIPTIIDMPAMNAYMVVLFEVQPFGRYLSDHGMLFSVILLMGIFLLTLLVLLLFYLNFRSRINSLVLLLDSFDGDNFHLPLPQTGYYDELGKIELHTVKMQHRLKTLIEEEYKVKLQNISAQYEVLTAYINPHFLYNTLNSISAVASMEDASETNEMILALSDMFRYSADMRRHQVRLSDELKNVNDYLYIQGTRYKATLVFRVDVPEELKTCKMPKLILQPIVENCFKHGFDVKGGDGQNKELIISAVREGIYLKIYVMDNGRGMEPEEQERINRILADETYTDRTHKTTEIGLSNVNKRLKLLYGDACGIQISCQEENFTCVKLLLLYEPFGEDE